MLLYHWIWMTFTALSGTAMALLVSSLVKTERAALTCVPLLLVPQMLFAGALVSYKEMNHGLFNNTKEVRERGGVPVPAAIMPLRYAYESMIVAQATRNPFEVERIRLQRRIDRIRDLREKPTDKEMVQFELAKEGLRRLLAAGATDKMEASALLERIRRMATGSDLFAVETMKVWPEEEPNARPASDFFVNERIDLLVREAETFRSDYRNDTRRVVFHALKKPLPWAGPPPPPSAFYYSDSDEIETQKFCGIILLLFIAICCTGAILALSLQNRKTR
jgi:hypothetical protein